MSVRVEHCAVTILYAVQNEPSFTERQIVKRLLHTISVAVHTLLHSLSSTSCPWDMCSKCHMAMIGINYYLTHNLNPPLWWNPIVWCKKTLVAWK